MTKRHWCYTSLSNVPNEAYAAAALVGTVRQETLESRNENSANLPLRLQWQDIRDGQGVFLDEPTEHISEGKGPIQLAEVLTNVAAVLKTASGTKVRLLPIRRCPQDWKALSCCAGRCEFEVSPVCFGFSEAVDAILGNVHLARRLDGRNLPTCRDDVDLSTIIQTLIAAMPLKRKSNPKDNSLKQILAQTSGVTSRIFDFVRIAAAMTQSHKWVPFWS